MTDFTKDAPTPTATKPPTLGTAPSATTPPTGPNPFLDPVGFRRFHHMAEASDPLGDQATAAAGKLVTGASQALDFQRERTARLYTGKTGYEAQTEALRHKIPPLQALHDWHAPDTGIKPLDAFQHKANELGNNLIDAAMWLPLDPLTWETFGGGALGKTAAVTGLRATARAGVAKVLNNTHAGKLIYKYLGPWGGTVAAARGAAAGDIGKGLADVETAQGAGHSATAEGQRWEQHVDRRIDEIVNGVKQKTLKNKNGRPVKMTVKEPGAALTDAEKLRVIQQLDGEARYSEHVPLKPMTPREQTAYRLLRSLTAMDFHEGQRAITAYALRTQIPDASLRDEVASYFKSGKEPVVPEPGERVRTPYGEPQPRQRVVPFEQPLVDPKVAYDTVTADMTPEDKAAFSKALTGLELAKKLPEHLSDRLGYVQEALRKKYSGAGGDEVRELPPAPRYNMVPKNQAEIERMEKVREAYLKVLGVVSKQQEGGLVHFRQNYMPMAHEDLGDPLGREGYSSNPAELRNPRLTNERPDVKFRNAKQLERGFKKGLAPNLNRQVQTRVLNEAIPELLNDPEIEKLFGSEVRATGKRRTPEQWAGDIMRAAVGLPRAALVSLSPGHAWNEANMAMNVVPIEHQPKFFKDVIALGAKIFKAQNSGDLKEYASLTAPGRKLGAGVGSFSERKPFFQQFPEWVPGVGGKSVPILSKWSKLNNNLVWAVSEAIRQKYAEYLVEHGEAQGLRAGGLAEKRLVDYQYRTPLQKGMRYIAPFGTYRGGIPGAVAGGVLRRPFQAATLNRATGGVMYGDKPEPGQPGWEAFMPTAEVGRLFNFGSETSTSGRTFPVSGVGDYLRGSLGIPIAAGLNAAQDILAPGLKPSHWATYGQAWLPKRLPNGNLDFGFLLMSALSGIPQAQTILEANGMSRFQWRGLLNEAMRQGMRAQYTPPQPAPTPLPVATPRPGGGMDFTK
jgi:hypothetical protein